MSPGEFYGPTVAGYVRVRPWYNPTTASTSSSSGWGCRDVLSADGTTAASAPATAPTPVVPAAPAKIRPGKAWYWIGGC